jgi:hypothetical protein
VADLGSPKIDRPADPKIVPAVDDAEPVGA